MSPRRQLFIALGLVASLAACQSGHESVPAPSVDRRTTSPELALSNLNGQIKAAKRQLAILPTNLPVRQSLVALLLARTQYIGSYDDFDDAFAVVNEALAMDLAPAQTAVMHAQVLSSVHRFDEALLEISRAESLGAKDLASMRQTIALARGEDPAAIIAQRSSEAAEFSSYTSQTRLAAALNSGERYAESDLAYQRALENYRDVSPFPIAWVAFQRGVMWGESAGDRDRAQALYSEAVRTLPQYVVGNVHLSEIEVEEGHADAAIARLESIVDTTVDPEPASRLAQFLATRDPERSRQYAKRAAQGYQRLLDKYPLAFADHAAEFYLGAGNDASRALELALLNLDNRKTARAYHLAIQSALAADKPTLACELADSGDISVPEADC